LPDRALIYIGWQFSHGATDRTVIVIRHLNQITGFKVRCFLVAFETVSRVHIGVNTVDINTEAAGSNITEYHPHDDKPHAGMCGLYVRF